MTTHLWGMFSFSLIHRTSHENESCHYFFRTKIKLLLVKIFYSLFIFTRTKNIISRSKHQNELSPWKALATHAIGLYPSNKVSNLFNKQDHKISLRLSVIRSMRSASTSTQFAPFLSPKTNLKLLIDYELWSI